MDAYTKEMLALAVEACEERDMRLAISSPGVGFTEDCWHVTAYVPATGENRPSTGINPTLADAIAALLAEWGVEVPERPSMTSVGYLRAKLRDAAYRQTRGESIADVHAVEELLSAPQYRLSALALLEGGAK